MSIVFIYTLNCPITGNPRYVGKAKNPAKRFSCHLADKEKNHRTNWILSLRYLGLEPIMEVIQETPETEWKKAECQWIKIFKIMGFDLVNGTAGGDCGTTLGMRPWNFRKKMSPEYCAKNRKSHLGKRHSEETKRKMSLSRSGEKHPDFGKKFSPERCASMSISRLGKKLSSEHRANISASLTGNKYRLGKKPWNFGKKKDKVNGRN